MNDHYIKKTHINFKQIKEAISYIKKSGVKSSDIEVSATAGCLCISGKSNCVVINYHDAIDEGLYKAMDTSKDVIILEKVGDNPRPFMKLIKSEEKCHYVVDAESDDGMASSILYVMARTQDLCFMPSFLNVYKLTGATVRVTVFKESEHIQIQSLAEEDVTIVVMPRSNPKIKELS